MKISIMIEGQNGLNWHFWKKIAEVVENYGFYGLYRSDHFTNSSPPDKDSLELWTSLTYLATTTKKIKFGSLVSPTSFRNPVFTARMAAAVDDLSSGRLKLGLGAGWQEREHQIFGFDLLNLKERFKRFEEGLFIITNLLQSEQPTTLHGKYFQVNGAFLLPRPQRQNGPEILIGGNGKKYTFPMVVKFADEWNALFLTPDKYREKNDQMNHLLEKSGKNPESIRRSLMTNLTFSQTEEVLNKKLKGKDPNEMTQKGYIIGSAQQVANRLYEYQDAGLDEIMLQWLDLDDMDGLVDFAENILLKFQGS